MTESWPLVTDKDHAITMLTHSLDGWYLHALACRQELYKRGMKWSEIDKIEPGIQGILDRGRPPRCKQSPIDLKQFVASLPRCSLYRPDGPISCKYPDCDCARP